MLLPDIGGQLTAAVTAAGGVLGDAFGIAVALMVLHQLWCWARRAVTVEEDDEERAAKERMGYDSNRDY